MFFATLILAVTPSFTPAVAPQGDARAVRKQFVELAEKQDRTAVLALWRAHPGDVLGTIDADLEGSLRLREKAAEKSVEPDLKAIAALHTRALWGAHLAAEASGHPLIVDYASSFVGWNAEQQKQFRDGQKAYGRATKALAAGDAKAALEAGLECLQLTGPLGDWWGSAMGCDAIAAAQANLGNHEKALESAAFGRTICHDLGLVGDEYGALQRMLDACRALERTERAKAACDSALALAKQLGDDEGVKRLTETRAALDARK